MPNTEPTLFFLLENIKVARLNINPIPAKGITNQLSAPRQGKKAINTPVMLISPQSKLIVCTASILLKLCYTSLTKQLVSMFVSS
jgi:hypothetical protein